MHLLSLQVRHISLPPAARDSAQYHAAIRALDSIVLATLPAKVAVIEDMRFEFDFLSTILLVWKTETSRQAEEAKRLEEERRAEDRRKVEEARRMERDAVVEILEEDEDDPPPLLALPAPGQQIRPSPVRPPSAPPRRTPTAPQARRGAPPTQLALPAPPRVASAADPMPVDPAAASELPIRWGSTAQAQLALPRTKCNLCPDKTSENVEELVGGAASWTTCHPEIL